MISFLTRSHRLKYASQLLASLIAAFGLRGGVSLADESLVRIDERHRALFDRYCVACHGPTKQEGTVRLDDLSFTITDVAIAERWQKVLNVLNSGEMPPKEEHQPLASEKLTFLEDLSKRMVEARQKLSDSGGVITLRRLNKREYRYTLQDLLGVEVDVKDLPNDGGGGTFDTIGKSLFLSSDQFEQYLAIARKALERAWIKNVPVERKTVRVEVEEEANRRITGILRGYQMGGYRAYKQWMASGGRPPSDFGLVDDKEMEFRLRVWNTNAPVAIDYLTRAETKTGAFLTIDDPNNQVGIAIPDDMPAGLYRIRAQMGVAPRTPAERTFVEVGIRGKSLNDAMALIDCRKVDGTINRPQILEFEVSIPPLAVPLKEDIGSETKKRILVGERVVALRERQHNIAGAATYHHRKTLTETGFGIEPALWVDWLEWEGPFAETTTSQTPPATFPLSADGIHDDLQAREFLEKFAARAFRGRDVEPTYLEQLVEHYRQAIAAGDSVEDALKIPMSIVLASPSFLYQVEPAEESHRHRQLDGVELANRLAYFLWSSPPDEQLLALARSGALNRPRVLQRQVDRLLNSPKSWRMVRGFSEQWLQMERLDFFQFNYRLYPRFDDSVKQASRDEVFHTIKVLLDEDLPIGTFLKSDFVVINDLLGQYYGIDGVKGKEFRKVSVPDGMPRGGVLGMAAVLAMGSDGERSSPVERGAWILRKLLNAPPPPAPANVPQLSRHAGKLFSARQLLTAHMEEPQCSQCHSKIDPIGFALEHFDAVGLWRDKEYSEIAVNNRVKKSMEHEIDARGQLPDGQSFDGFFGLREAVAAHEPAFARGLIQQMIAYSHGRPYSFTDEDLVAKILSEHQGKDRTLRQMIHAIVFSQSFRAK